MKLSAIHPNPKNPRTIKDDRFKKLVKSIQEFPKMMELRPIITDETGMVLGGNQRLKALKELGMKEIPDSWVKKASDLTEEERARFIIVDNVEVGDWDEGLLSEDYSLEDLQDWGVELESYEPETQEYEGKNTELTDDNLSGEMKIVLKFSDEERYWLVKEALEKINADAGQAVWSLIKGA